MLLLPEGSLRITVVIPGGSDWIVTVSLPTSGWMSMVLKLTGTVVKPPLIVTSSWPLSPARTMMSFTDRSG